MDDDTSVEDDTEGDKNAVPGTSKMANNPSSPLVTQLFKSAPREAKTRPLVEPLLLLAPGCESVSSTISTPSTASPSASSDKTDNRDAFTFCPELHDMRREDERLKSFEKWPLSFLSPEQLAQNGFYYLGRGDEVRCAFCKVEIMRWVEGDDPAKDHQRWAPQCPFLRKHAGVGNVPLDTTTVVDRDECGARTPPSATPMRIPGPVHTRYASEAARLRSFIDWPRSMRQTPEELAEAGFFYTGKSDKTKCFYCDGGLKDWENDDVPWEQHARWFDKCAYVQLVKGREYVQKVKSEACVIKAPKPEKESPPQAPAAKEPEKQVEDSKLCKICYVEELNVCFVPCGHVVACSKCALTSTKCPVCRKTIENAVRLYYS